MHFPSSCPAVYSSTLGCQTWLRRHGNDDGRCGSRCQYKIACKYLSFTLIEPHAGTEVGYTPLHIAALHGHTHILKLLIGTYGAKENLRDYSGHLACQYLNIREAPEEMEFVEFHVAQAREHTRNRKLASLFQSKKKWGSAEDLAPIEEEGLATASHQLLVPAFRTRKFSR
ncbi:hypothetical protein DPEC_G00012590 [Dallia pectoralis]|uniref:Uncharacterized protein n=1 Tax=Dallia pectoralis TaxID=75939 RepID=A0ACC2HMB4_DALPE|nr:hypothetical protein DPEC_G00012590 [Dallia pectoralis]